MKRNYLSMWLGWKFSEIESSWAEIKKWGYFPQMNCALGMKCTLSKKYNLLQDFLNPHSDTYENLEILYKVLSLGDKKGQVTFFLHLQRSCLK